MKQKSINIERDGSGTVTLIPEEPEDMVDTFFYFPYNSKF
jgi:hypothetical protein